MEKQEEKIKEPFVFKAPWKLFFWEALFFVLIFVLGIAVVYKIPAPEPISLRRILLSFLLATLFLFFITRAGKGKTAPERGIKLKWFVLKAIFVLAVFAGASATFSSWLPDTIALILTAILIFCWFKKSSVLIHNLAMILAIAGIAVFLGLSLRPETVAVLLMILSVYDFLAVYKTKHMIRIAEEMMSVGAVLALIIPQEIAGFKANLKEVKPGGKFMILGGGDVAFPLLLCFSLSGRGIIHSLIIASFALLGLFVSFRLFVGQQPRRPIPALPAVALFSLIGFLLLRFFTM